MDIKQLKESMIDNIEVYATETVKADLLAWFSNKGIPAAKEIAAAYEAKLKEQSAQENGWNKIRDALILPFLIELTLWGLGKAVSAAGTLEATRGGTRCPTLPTFISHAQCEK